MDLIEIAEELRDQVRGLEFGPPVVFTYRPLDYAFAAHRLFLERYGRFRPQTLLLGMNPGPFGMAQTGVPFGAVGKVREYLGIETEVGRPEHEHPKRPVEGFACRREEVSGERFWNWAESSFGRPEAFFKRFFVHNYCPLLFLTESGANLPPDKLKRDEQAAIAAPCRQALRATATALGISTVIGVGAWAEGQARAALEGLDLRFGRILHPSPASPLANRDWAGQVERQIADLGLG